MSNLHGSNHERIYLFIIYTGDTMNNLKGLLDIIIVDQNTYLPIKGARVILKNRLSSTDKEYFSDEIGQINSIELIAPSVDISRSEESDLKPYSEYDLIVTRDGYAAVAVEGVQIYADSTALQEVAMPLLKEQTNETISIPKPVLYGDYPRKEPEDDIKDVPKKPGFIVLPKPVVPEYIIVHAGRPEDKKAKNYKVLYKNYIKNVACCEIYTTWPKETIKANVLAIISFTLNRVYTEWYKAKGYDFTITSVTSHDQAFSYGRTIYKEISQVVDELFDTYINKKGHKQPYFAQYCDGKNSKCPKWMTQWGSKNLGDSGYKALDILKHFYGQDLTLKEAEKVEGIPYSYPGYVLKLGYKSKPVRTIQEQLNEISKSYPLIKKLKVDGIYGKNTKNNVEAFQKAFKLPVTGDVDKKTWYKISEIYAAVKKMMN